jgi:hypothetical protein
VNEQSAKFAGGDAADYPLVAPEGGKEALLAEMAPFSLGSDHQVYTDSSFGIPAIYLNDWPDRYIHTNFDTPANVDPTKLKRSAFIGAASGYFLANAQSGQASQILQVVQINSLRRTAMMLTRRTILDADESANLVRQHLQYERTLTNSLERFFRVPDQVRDSAKVFLDNLERQLAPANRLPVPIHDEYRRVFRRRASLKGPMTAFGYDYFTDHFAYREKPLGLTIYRGLHGSGGDYAYEVLNLVDGRRTVQEIRDAVSATYGPIPVESVFEYLQALETIRVIERQK